MRREILFGVLAVVLLFGVVGLASADTVVYPGAGSPNATASGTVNVSATVNPKISMSITTTGTASQTVEFGSLDPGTYSGWQVGIEVDSNKTFDATAVESFGNFTAEGIVIGRTIGGADADWVDIPKGENILLTDDYDIDIPWSATAGTYTGTVQYTVTQK